MTEAFTWSKQINHKPSRRDKTLALQTIVMNTFHISSHRLRTILTFNQNVYYAPLHVNDLTFVSGSAGDGGGVTGEKAARTVTTVCDSISTSVSVKPLDIFHEGPPHFIISRWTKNVYS